MLKNCALLSLCAGLSLAADFITGQGARLVIGQTTFTSQELGASDKLLGAAGGVAYANGKLYIADGNRLNFTPINNRVLVMDTSTFPKPTDEIQPYISRCPVCVGQASLVLGQKDFTSTAFGLAADKLRVPTAIATDGSRLVVADTFNNRVLLWKSLPTSNGQPADIVVGQPRFDQNKTPVVTDAKSLRAPQGVWIQGNRLFVADAQNHRVLIWNSIPTVNEQPADIVLGQNNFTDAVELDPIKKNVTIAADSLLTPTSVSSDGVRLFVTDLGLNRVLIWNTIPSRNHQPADVVIGQPDFSENASNNTPKLCDPNDVDHNGVPDKDTDGNLLYPARCKKTLNFPRFALSDGTRLFVADGGNDRVMIYNTIPTQNGAPADIILGQPDEFVSVVSSSTDLFHPLLKQSAADVTPTPTSLAWDGQNLYVPDPSNRRILVFTPGEALVPINGVRNAASREVYAVGSIAVALAQTVNATTGAVETSKITEGDTVTLEVSGVRDYTYTIQADDTLVTIMQALANLVNAGNGDFDVIAQYEPALSLVKLQARHGGVDGNDISITLTVSDDASVTPGISGPFLRGGSSATILAPGTLVSVLGSNLASQAVVGDTSQDYLPLDLGGVEAYFDGIRAPLMYVSPTQINAQLPFDLQDANSASFYLRIKRADGSVIATTAVGIPIDTANPGLFAEDGEDPRPGIAFHASSNATAAFTVDGGIEEGDHALINIEGRKYNYYVKADDTLQSIRDALVTMINSNPEESVIAVSQPAFRRIQLRAKIPGPAGEGIQFNATSDAGDDDQLFLAISSLSEATCCSNVKDSRVTVQNPAVPGETIYLLGTGLGTVAPLEAQVLAVTGQAYHGPADNTAVTDVSGLGNGSTTNILSAGLIPGGRGLYKIVLEIGPGTVVGSNNMVGITVTQSIYTSNTVNVPIHDPVKSNAPQ